MLRWIVTFAVAALSALAPTIATPQAQPLPDQTVNAWRAAIERWASRRAPEDRLILLRMFRAYGMPSPVLSDSNLALMEREFERFAPILIEAQRPPFFAHADLQLWFRARATPTQSSSMMATLRLWLTPEFGKADIEDSVRMADSIQRDLLQGRLYAVEELGKWRDRKALPDLKAMMPKYRGYRSIFGAAIRAITDSLGSGLLAIGPHGHVRVHRAFSELDSVTIVCMDDVTYGTVVWRADQKAQEAIWSSLSEFREAVPKGTTGIGDRDQSSFRASVLVFHFQDGVTVRLERQYGDLWEYSEDARPHGEAGRFPAAGGEAARLNLENPSLTSLVAYQLSRAEVSPPLPRLLAESVTLLLDQGEIEVNCTYQFEGPGDNRRQRLRYPLANDSWGKPEIEAAMLRPLNQAVGSPVQYHHDESGFWLDLEPGTAKRYEFLLAYRQSTSRKSVTYALLPTEGWGNPVRRVSYQVIIDRSLGKPKFNLPFKEVDERPTQHRRFLFDTRLLRPEKDLIVTW